MTHTAPIRPNFFVLNLPAEIRMDLAETGVVLDSLHDVTDLWNEQARVTEVLGRIASDVEADVVRQHLKGARRGYERLGRLLSRLEALRAAENAVADRHAALVNAREDAEG